jgi:Matrixin
MGHCSNGHWRPVKIAKLNLAVASALASSLIACGSPDVSSEPADSFTPTPGARTRSIGAPTGAGREETLAQQPRCGFSDAAHESGKVSSFAVNDTNHWFFATLIWKVFNTDDNIPINDIRAAAAAAFARWAEQTNLTFIEITSTGITPDIEIRFLPFSDPTTTVIARADFPYEGGDIQMNAWKTWSVDPNWDPQSGTFHVGQVLTHEIGHALGLFHTTADPFAVMASGNFLRSSLRIDDEVAVSVLYDTYTQVPGLAKDIGVGGQSEPAVWVIGTNPVGNAADFGIHQLNTAGTGWSSADGGAVRIAVSTAGIPWIANSVGKVFFRPSGNALTGAWEEYTGRLASDIAVGVSIPWIITKTPIGSAGDFTIARGNGSGGWTDVDGGAIRIAVDFNGDPWVVNAVGQIFRRVNGAWQHNEQGLAKDIGVGHSNMWDSATEPNYPWVVGTNTESSGLPVRNGFGTFVWNQQDEIGDAPGRSVWHPMNRGALQGAIAISVGPGAKPWIVGADGRIYRTK